MYEDTSVGQLVAVWLYGYPWCCL